ncbi:TMV resistance protein N-like [Neltuma alba]|uniref:TMV resistance protein N-like n=1 Tax=Neltuma alba TaxID=207710 RepID=UPI0010A3E5A4|nr:TMV resistance protein N-like [Prosopis alba]
MRKRGIHAFVNDESLMSDKEEMKAIVVIFKNYASSTYCLDSLATILECCRIEYRFVYLILYDMQPLELQHQTGSCGQVFARLEKIFKHDKQRMQKWRLALAEAADSRRNCYFIPKNAIEDEHIITKRVTGEVCRRIDKFPLPHGDLSGLFESWDREEAVSILDIRSNEEVKMEIAKSSNDFTLDDFHDLIKQP